MSEQNNAPRAVALSQLPIDELLQYGQGLGLRLERGMGQGELLRLVRERQELLLELDREALLDIVVWARRPVQQSASKEELARQISTIGKMDLPLLSERGLWALARLRGVGVREGEDRAAIESRLRRAEPLWDKIRRKRRKLVGNLISKLVEDNDNPDDTYRFLPEDPTGASLKERISEEGVMGGIARKLRGVADDYVREKLDEIEARIDRKLDEIDRRLAEWRDQEIRNRLKIIKITLVASVIVAVLSLGYSVVRKWTTDEDAPPPVTTTTAAQEGDAACERESQWI